VGSAPFCRDDSRELPVGHRGQAGEDLLEVGAGNRMHRGRGATVQGLILNVVALTAPRLKIEPASGHVRALGGTPVQGSTHEGNESRGVMTADALLRRVLGQMRRSPVTWSAGGSSVRSGASFWVMILLRKLAAKSRDR
jgi:hypothetical protein